MRHPLPLRCAEEIMGGDLIQEMKAVSDAGTGVIDEEAARSIDELRNADFEGSEPLHCSGARGRNRAM